MDFLPRRLEENIDALQHEAALLARFTGTPHLVSVVEDRSHRSLPVLVLERLGESVLEIIDRPGALDLPKGLVLVRDVATGLACLRAESRMLEKTRYSLPDASRVRKKVASLLRRLSS